ncbi:polysaccharide pyruvyl transferase family protein [Enterococcus sp. AZ163]|uniref:polysaccharide pyruvyl transferase family protein n=1 Tax=Enterococcus sp. AZ163 TaxID=2774638 RepID=UPI003D29E59A
MRTATITLHSAHNNGSFLQAFALQKSIIGMGVENQIINYVPPAQYSLYQNIILKEVTPKGIIKGMLNISQYNKLKERKNRFNRVQECLEVTDKFEDESEFDKFANKYDCLIAGSDQIWNSASMPDFTSLYFLPVNKYKVAYAPSFGKSLEKQFSEKNVTMISAFDRLSVREQSAQKELQKRIPSKDINVVLDPTFLLNKEEYESLVNGAKCKYEGKYIFFYCIKASNDVLKSVKEIGEKLKLPIITIFTGVNTYKCQVFGQKVDFAAGPEEFLSYIKNAQYVISNSFHGIVFSIIYNKIFYRIADDDNGKIKIDERLDSILNFLNLNQQNLIAGENPILNEEIDYTLVSKNLNTLIHQSSGWLKESLELAEESRN